jgi:peptidoglycan/LPS O-acetylase OafA/YrhL
MLGNIGIFEFYMLTWIILTFVGYKFAESKNLSPWLGAALGFFLSVIGILIIALLPRREPDSTVTPLPPGA